MNMPVSRLSKFSDPSAVPVSWEETSSILESAELFWVCTVRTDGRPHATPVVGAWVDGAFCFSTGAREQKRLNMQANPHVVVITGCNTWDRGIDIVIEGDAVQVTDQVTLGRLAAAFRPKWDGRWTFAAADGGFRDASDGDGPGQAQVFTVTPAKVFAHAKGDPFGETRHTF
ncbi:MAG TPA: pyridoxamine 5'-phosphate oxidase family protein [Streptosporangiaceae bacterium]|jgi:hypothetical protein